MNASTNIEGIQQLYYSRKARAYVLPNALEFEDRDYISKIPLDSRLQDWINGRLMVAAIGRLSSQKNFDLFFDLAARIHEIRKDVCFCLVGEPVCTSEGGAILEHLQKRAVKENVESYLKMTGRIDDIPGFLTNVDILVSTSLFEGCPNVVLEAMRAARPIVMTNSCDTAQIIRPGSNGFVVGLNDLAMLSDCVLQLLSSESLRQEFGRTSRQIVESNFSNMSAAWTLAKIYLTEYERRKQ